MMSATWKFEPEPISAGVQRYRISTAAGLLTRSDVLSLWQADECFVQQFSETIAQATLGAFRWETPPWSTERMDRPFEFVLVDDPHLEQPPERAPFAKHFAGAAMDVVTFTNLGGDATLIVPCPLSDVTSYPHLAAFVRSAPVEQQCSLWRAVGTAAQTRLGNTPFWLSTAGAGVAWLHVRLDARPKYYAYRPYCALA